MSKLQELLAQQYTAGMSSGLEDTVETSIDPIQTKLDTLAQRKQEKINGLAGIEDTQAYKLGQAIYEGYTPLGREITQSDIARSNRPDDKIDPNQRYHVRQHHDAYGQNVGYTYEPLTGEYDSRNMYLRNLGEYNGEQIHKLGLARNDLTDEMIEQGITPEQARYMDKERNVFERLFGLNKVYKGDGGNYDGREGPGVNVKGEALMDMPLLSDVATRFEYERYRDPTTIAARVMGTQDKEGDIYKDLGGGGTEYTYEKLDPLFNPDVEKATSVPEGVPMPKKPYGYVEPLQFDAKGNLVVPEEEQKVESSVGNAVKALAYRLGEGVANTVDLVPEIAEYAYGNIVGDKKWKDVEGFYNDKDSKAFKEWVGYNDTVMNQLGADAVAAVKDAWNNGNYGKLVDVLGDAITTPELLGDSVGYVLGMLLPGAAAQRGVRMVTGVQKAAKAAVAADKTKKLTMAQAIANEEAKKGAGYKIAKIMSGSVGYVGEAEQFGRDAEELYMKTYNEEMPTEQKFASRGIGMLYAYMDATIAKALLLGKDPIAKAVPEAVKRLPEAMKQTFVGKTAVLAGSTAARAAGAFALEGSTEGIQTAMEKVAGMYKQGEVGVGDVLEDQKFDVAGGALLGGVGGTQMAAGSIAYDAAKGTKDATTQKIADIKAKQEETQAKLDEEAIEAQMAGDTTTGKADAIVEDRYKAFNMYRKVPEGESTEDANTRRQEVLRSATDVINYGIEARKGKTTGKARTALNNKIKEAVGVYAKSAKAMFDWEANERGLTNPNLTSEQKEEIREGIREDVGKWLESNGINEDGRLEVLDALILPPEYYSEPLKLAGMPTNEEVDTNAPFTVPVMGQDTAETNIDFVPFPIPGMSAGTKVDQEVKDGKRDIEGTLNQEQQQEFNNKSTKEQNEQVKDKVEEKIEYAKVAGETGETDTHTVGLSQRTYEKLAKSFNIDIRKVKASLDIAMGIPAEIRKMKPVGKEANKKQYEDYYGKGGVVPKFIEYKKAVQAGNVDEAVKSIGVLRAKAYKQEVRAGRYNVARDAVRSKLTNYIQEVADEDKTGRTFDDVLHSEDAEILAKGLQKDSNYKKFATVVGEKHIVYATEMLQSMRGETTAEDQVVSAMQEYVTHVDKMLSSEGIPRQKAEFKRSDNEARKRELEAEIAQLEDEEKKRMSSIDAIKSKAVKTLELEKLELDIQNTLKNRRDELSKVNEQLDFGIKVRTTLKQKSKADKETLEEKAKKKIKTKSGQNVGSITPTEAKKQGIVEDENITIEKIEKKVDQAYIPKELEKLKEAKATKENIAPRIKRAEKRVAEAVKKVDLAEQEFGELSRDLDKLGKDLAELYEDREKQRAARKAKEIELKRAKEALEVYKDIEASRKQVEDAYDLTEFAEESDLANVRKSLNNGRMKLSGLSKFAHAVRKGLKGIKIGLKKIKHILGSGSIADIEKRIDDIKAFEVKVENQIEAKENEIREAIREQLKYKESVVEIDPKVDKLLEMYKELHDIRQKLFKQTSTKGQRYRKYNDRIKKIEARLFGTGKLDKAIENGFDTGLEGQTFKVGKNNRTVDVPTSIKQIAQFRDTLLGNVDMKALKALVPEEGKELYDEILKAVPTLATKLDVMKYKDEKTGKEVVGDIQRAMQLETSPFSAILFDKNGKMNEDVARVMALSLFELIATDGMSLNYNLDEQIARMMGKNEAWEVSKAERDTLKKAGKFKKLLAGTVGGNMFGAMGIKFNDDEATREHKDDLQQDAGQMILLLGEELGYFKPMTTGESDIKAEVWNKMIVDTAKEENPELREEDHKKLPGYIKNDKITGVPMVQPGPMMTKENVDKIKVGVKAINEAWNLQTFKKNYRTYNIDAVVNGKEYEVRGSNFDVPTRSEQTLRVLEDQEYNVIKAADMFQKAIEKDREKVLYMMGWKSEEDMAEDMLDDREAQMAVNEELEGFVDEFMDMKHRLDIGAIENKLFFNWFFSKNGRYMLDSVGINPQTDKHGARWYVLPKENVDVLWNMNDEVDELYFKAGVAQAFGVSIDGELTSEVKRLGDMLINEGSDKLLGIIDKAKKEDIKENGKLKFELNGEKFSVDHIMHTYQAIDAIRDLEKAKNNRLKKYNGEVRATMVVEFDAATSGFQIKTMNIPLMVRGDEEANKKQVKLWLKRGVIAVDEKMPNGPVDYKVNAKDNEGKKLLDSYKTLVVRAEEELQKALKTLLTEDVENGGLPKDQKDLWNALTEAGLIPEFLDENKEVTKEARELFKFPFMMFGYAAGLNSIKRYIANDLSLNTIRALYKDDTGNKKYQAIADTIGLPKDWKEQAKEKPLDDVKADMKVTTKDGKTYNIKKPIQEVFADLFKRMYGGAVESAINEEFGTMIEVNTKMISATKVMFRLYKKEFEAKLKEMNKPTATEVKELIRSLDKKFPLIKAPWSDAELDRIALFDEKKVTREDGKVQTRTFTPDGQKKQLTIQGLMKELDEAGAAGAVLPIHWIDGTQIGQLLIKSGVLGIHDAVVLGLEGRAKEDAVRELNKAMYEVNRDYNLLEEVYQSMLGAIAASSKEDLTALDKEVSKDKRIGGLYELVEDMGKLVEDNNKARKWLYEEAEVTVGNYVGFKGSEFSSKEATEIGPKDLGVTKSQFDIIKDRINNKVKKACN